jgi:pentapeptide MXKDX repeat protein
MVQRTFAARFGGMKTIPGLCAGRITSKCMAAGKYFAQAVTIGTMRPFRRQRHPPLSKQIRRDQFAMTISARFACGISAAAIALSLLLGPAAFAEDKMGKDSMMKKDTMSKDSMKKNTMSKDSMKKDDAMKKDSMKKDDIKK